MLTCCQEPLALIRYRAVQVQAPCKIVYQVGGFRTPNGWYPAGNLFADQLAVMNTVMARCIDTCKQLPYPDTYQTPPFTLPLLKAKRYDLVHPNPIYDLPGRLITSGTELNPALSPLQPGQQIITKTNLGFDEWADSEWNRITLYEWQMGAIKAELTFSDATQTCVRIHTCTVANYGPGVTQPQAQVHELLPPDFDIVANRNQNTCGNTIGWKAKTLAPGTCPP